MIATRPCRVVLVLAILAFATSARADPDDQNPPRVLLGYLYGPIPDIDFQLYTHLAHTFVTVEADGTLQNSPTVPSRALTTDAHRAGVQVLLSLGGWGFDEQFAAIASHPEAEDRFVASVLKMVDNFDYDGIDFDWEYPDTEAEVVGFERITRRFRAGVDAIGLSKRRTMRITMAASSNPETLRRLKTDFLVATMDWINVMTYDYTGSWSDYAGHQSPLFASSKAPGSKLSTAATLEHLLNDRKIPADRLVLGIPLYGRGFAVAQPYASTRGIAATKVPAGGYASIVKRLDQGWTRTWDDETKTPWLHAPDGSAVIGYDDAESVAAKTVWANQHHLRGVFFWEIHQDRLPDGSHPLQETARRVWMGGNQP